MSWRTFSPKNEVLKRIKEKGGWVNAHAHIDRAFIIDEKSFTLNDGTLKDRWFKVDDFKKKSGVDDYYEHMAWFVEKMIDQNVQAIGGFIDVDPIVKDKAIKAAEKIRKDYGGRIKIKYINQALKGALDKEARKWLEVGAEFVDIIGGLPEKDSPKEAEHLDVLFDVAKKNGNKPLHVHIDQFNMPDQRDTELLVDKTIEHDYQGKVTAIHCISVGSQPKEYRNKLYKRMKDVDMNVVACPIAWIDNSWVGGKEEDIVGPIHNCLTPVKEMLAAGLTVAIGTDDTQDFYKPFNEGDMWSELQFLLEADRLYNFEDLANIASTNGLKALWLE